MMDHDTRTNNHSFHNNLPLVFNCTACQAAAKKVNGLEINGNYCHMFTYKRCNNWGFINSEFAAFKETGMDNIRISSNDELIKMSRKYGFQCSHLKGEVLLYNVLTDKTLAIITMVPGRNCSNNKKVGDGTDICNTSFDSALDNSTNDLFDTTTDDDDDDFGTATGDDTSLDNINTTSDDSNNIGWLYIFINLVLIFGVYFGFHWLVTEEEKEEIIKQPSEIGSHGSWVLMVIDITAALVGISMVCIGL